MSFGELGPRTLLFYSPYLDSGQLALTMTMLASLPLVFALQALAPSGRARLTRMVTHRFQPLEHRTG
jgi:hypothetical protein